MHSFTFNGHSSDEFGIRIERFPDLNRSERKYKSASVAGRNGNIYQMQNAWEEVTVSYQIFAGERAAGAAVTDFTEIVEWLNSADDYAVLTDTYDPAHYRLAVFVDELEIESQWHTFGKATIRFRCRPQRYLTKGWDMLPKMTAGTYTNAGVTAVVDEKGTATFSGTGTASVNMIIPLEGSIVITQDMVDDGVYLHLNNTAIWSNLVTIYFCDNSNVTAITANALNLNNKITVPQSAVGKTIQRIRITAASGYTMSGTIMPQIISESQSVTVESGSSIVNPTNHTALPIITLIGNEIRTNMLDLEKTYNVASTIEGNGWVNEWQTDTVYVGKYTADSTNKFLTLNTATATSLGGNIQSQQNSTGRLTFTPIDYPGYLLGLGIGISLTPDSDYTISCSTSTGSYSVEAYFFDTETKQYNSSAKISRSGAGTLTLTFHVPETCMNTLIVFYKNDDSAGTFTSIMLASGTTAAEFIPYGTGSTEQLTINGTTLSFVTAGFDTAVIDCEKENFTIDGVNANMTATVYDQYENLAADYLRLEEGNNTVTFTSNITAASIVPHFWDL